MIGSEVRHEMTRRTTSRDRVLRALVDAGPRGRTNVELCQPEIGGLRAVGRVDELREHWSIETIRVRQGLYRYVLHGRREPRQEALFL